MSNRLEALSRQVSGPGSKIIACFSVSIEDVEAILMMNEITCTGGQLWWLSSSGYGSEIKKTASAEVTMLV